jgi:hypothetical protein
MKYEEYLKKLQETKTKAGEFPKPRTTTPRGQPVERRTFKILSSNVRRQNWNND